MSAQPFPPKYCSKCLRPIVVSWPPTEHKCEQADLSWALPPDTIQVDRAIVSQTIDKINAAGMKEGE